MLGMSLGRRIKERRLAKRWSQTTLGKSVGVTRNAVSQWEGGTASPASERLGQLAVILECDFNWLATGRVVQNTVSKGLPDKGAIGAGVWREVAESQDMKVRRVPVAPDPQWPLEAQFALRVEGNSVNKIAKDGTILHCVNILEAGIEIQQNDLVVVERHRGTLVETTVKRVRRDARGAIQLWPESEDPLYQKPITVGAKGSEVTIKALVIYVVTPVLRTR